MSEYRKLEDVLHILDNVMSDEGIKHKGKAIRKRLNELSCADVEKVVRCGDCQFAEVNGGDCHGVITITTRNYILELNETRYIPLDFCSYGKRKEGAE